MSDAPAIYLTLAAINEASLVLADRWHWERDGDEGFATWLGEHASDAWAADRGFLDAVSHKLIPYEGHVFTFDPRPRGDFAASLISVRRKR